MSYEFATASGHLIVVSFRVGLGILLLAAGVGKLLNVADFQKAIRAYRLLPPAIAPSVSVVLPVVEIAAGLALVCGVFRPLPQYAASGLFVVFAIGVAVNLLRGNDRLACGCFGSSGKAVSWQIVMRNVGLIGIALASTEHLVALPVILLSVWACGVCALSQRVGA